MKKISLPKMVQTFFAGAFVILILVACLLDSFFFLHADMGAPLCLGDIYGFVQEYSINFSPVTQVIFIVIILTAVGIYFFISGVNNIEK